MPVIPRILKQPEQPVSLPAPTYSLNQLIDLGLFNLTPIDSMVPVPRIPDPRIPAGEDPRIPRKDET